ncbi:MAG TPA: tetratricopeptide repeat protein [Candidatus Limnocylindrales bacterium]|nr:tetratricopeptide repeat protein [Candidatus Limnocylindrales bacterium]
MIKDAASSVASGNLDRADSDLASYLKGRPNDPRALNLLGMVRAAQQRNDEAEQLFKQVIALQPKSANGHVNLGLLYLQMSRVEDAVPQLQEALRIDPGRNDARGALLNALRSEAHDSIREGKLEKALSLLITARKLSPEDTDIVYDFGYVALRMSLYPDAETAFKKVLEHRPDDARALYGLGRAQIGLGRYQLASEIFSRYTKLKPADASGHYALGVTLASLEQFPKATLEFQRSIEIQPRQTESYVEIGRIELAENNFEAARGDFDRALAIAPQHAGALNGVGRVEFSEKHYDKATDDFRASIAADSSQREPHYYLGLTYARLGRREDSARELQIAQDREREDVERHRIVMKLLDSDENIDDSKPQP